MTLPLDLRSLVRAATPGVPDLFSLRCSLLTRAAGAVHTTLSALPHLAVLGGRRPDETRTAPSSASPAPPRSE